MSSNRNSVLPYVAATLEDVQETVGITQFQGEDSWYQTIGGLLVMGGKTASTSSAPVDVVFPAAVPTQLLTLMVQPVSSSPHNFAVTNGSLEGFQITHSGHPVDFYWFAVGV